MIKRTNAKNMTNEEELMLATVVSFCSYAKEKIPNSVKDKSTVLLITVFGSMSNRKREKNIETCRRDGPGETRNLTCIIASDRNVRV